MKKLLVFVCLLSTFSGCSKSPQEKAEAFAFDYMQKNLNDPRSYEPVETTCDSVFYCTFFEEETQQILQDLDEMQDLLSATLSDSTVKDEKLTKAIDLYELEKDFHSSYLTPYDKREIREAEIKVDKLKKEISNLAKTIQETKKTIEDDKLKIWERYKNCSDDSFYGWFVDHKYRMTYFPYKKRLENISFFVDPNMENILFMSDSYEYYLIDLYNSVIEEYDE